MNPSGQLWMRRSSYNLGNPRPAFTLDDLDGQPVSLGQFKGQVVLLDFWSSWCKPCISDLPNLRKIKEKTVGWLVVFLNISLDVDEAAWREAIDKHEIEGVHVRAEGWGTEVTKSYQGECPSCVLLGGLPRTDLRSSVWSQGYRRDCRDDRAGLVNKLSRIRMEQAA